ncbi:hypothetical protein ACHFCA_02600 [Delftia tsuruhatensis]
MPLRLPSTLAACARWALGLWLCVALASAFAPLARASGWERLCSAAGESVWVPSPAGQDDALAGSHGIDCPLCLPRWRRRPPGAVRPRHRWWQMRSHGRTRPPSTAWPCRPCPRPAPRPGDSRIHSRFLRLANPFCKARRPCRNALKFLEKP